MSVDHADLRARLLECEKVETFNAAHWQQQAARKRAALHLYGGAAREELEIIAVEHDVSALVAAAKVRGLRLAIEDLSNGVDHAAAE